MAIPKSFQLHSDGRKVTEGDIWAKFDAQGMKFFTKVPYSSSDYNAWLNVLLQIPGLIVKELPEKVEESPYNSYGTLFQKSVTNGLRFSYQSSGKLYKICDICKELWGHEQAPLDPKDWSKPLHWRYNLPSYFAIIHGYEARIEEAIYNNALSYERDRGYIKYIQERFNNRQKAQQK